MRFIQTLAFAMAISSLTYGDQADINTPVSKGCHPQEHTYKLSLQAIQSNFLGPDDVFDGNNGLPIAGQNIPTIVSITAKHRRDEVVLSIQPFSFTLLATGFMISQDLLPQDVSPKTATWIDFDAGSGIEGHVFRDGSIRFSGPDNAPLSAGTYSVSASKVSFSEKLFPSHAKGFFKHNGILVREDNFPISQGQTNMGGLPVTTNNGTDYAEYYGLAFYDGKIYTATTDNSFDQTATPISVFNELNRKGKHLRPQSDIVPIGFPNTPVPPTTDTYQLTEETISVNPTNTQQLATTMWTYHNPEPTMPVAFLFVSNDGGSTWNLIDAFAGLTLPTEPGFTPPLAASNQYCIFDANGNLFYTTLCVIATPDFSVITLVEYVLMSGDGGNTWQLVDFLSGINPDTFGLDFPVLGTGPGPDGSAVTWLMLKQDVTYAEINRYGSTLPLIASAYQTTGPGVLGTITHQEVPGTEPGGYGNISVGPKGEVLIVGTAVNNSVGTTPFSNGTLFYAFNKDGLNGTFAPAQFFINSNTGYLVEYLPEDNRDTFAHPWSAIDNNGRWYVAYVDQPSPHINQPNPNIFLIYSDNQGKSWSTPVRINNDVNNTTFHFLPLLAVDKITNDLVITWLDCREDETDTTTRLWGTVIKHGTLPVLR